jgi:uncharacterized protein (TIGR02246 family)
MATKTPPVAAENEIIITRVFAAPLDLVWQVWTQPEHIARWWGPRGFTTTVTAMDFREGGKWRYVMRGPDGAEYPVHGVFREIVPLARIVTSDEFDEGWPPPRPIDLPHGIVVTALFEDASEQSNGCVGGSPHKTLLTLRIVHETVEDKKKHEAMGVVGGWQSSFDCMDDHLASITGEAEIRQFMSAQIEAIRAKDVDRIMSFYAPDAVVFDVKPPFRTAGAEAWRQMWAACLPYFPDSFQIEGRELFVAVSGTLAFAHWLFRFITEDPNHPAAQTWMRSTACYRKTAGRWAIAHEHGSVPFDPHTGKAAFSLEV